jgi:hypothetical protein
MPAMVGSTADAAEPDAMVVDAATGATASASGRPDVSFTPNGTYALVRSDGLATITVVSLSDGKSTAVPLPSAPSDLTVSPDGTFALAVMRDTSTVAVLPLPAIANDPTSLSTIAIPGETIGRAIVAEGGATALLFTTAAPIARLTVLSLQPSPAFRTVTLHAPVLAVFPSADAKNAIVLHQITQTAGSSAKGAFSIVPIAADLPARIEATPAPPTAVALAPAGDRAIVSIRDDTAGTYGVYLAKMPSLEVVEYPLASPPLAVGMAAAAMRGYVAQNYSEGRITFIDLASGGARTITGFELGARIVNGSTP